MKKHSLFTAAALLTLSSAMVMSLVSSCEGPEGIAGKDANESCTQCHKSDVVEIVAAQFELSKHSYGEAAFEEAGTVGCAPCHESEAFKYVCANNTPVTFTKNETTGKYVNDYSVPDDKAYGEFACNTCHSSLHSAYDSTDFYPLTNTAAVAMTMYGGAKTIDLTANESKSNLCVKCHQPRPLTASLKDGNVLNYAALAASPTAVFFDPANTGSTNVLNPGYRTHVHYGTVGAIFAGKGGVEFTGSLSYSNSAHTTVASCQDCHMAAVTGKAGGHTFNAAGNFKGCNVSGCHESAPLDASSAKFADTRTAVKTLLNTLGEKITVNGVEVLHKNSDAETNMWTANTTKHFDGYLDIYDPALNPTGLVKNPAPGKSWTDEQKATNSALQELTLTNAQMGAIINFQLCLREYSLGIHNTSYTKALLQNSIEALN
jgi:hypothetical protein